MPQWRMICPGLFEGIPNPPLSDEQLDARAKLSLMPLLTAETHRFSTWKHRDGLDDVFTYCFNFASGIHQKPFLTLAGPPGTGKTHLALAIGWSWLETGRGLVRYYQVESLLDALRRGYDKEKQETNESTTMLLNFAAKCSLFIIDDLGAETTTEWAHKKLDEIIDTRYISKLSTIITTNVEPSRLPPRIVDRLWEGKVFVLDAESYRRRDIEGDNGPGGVNAEL